MRALFVISILVAITYPSTAGAFVGIGIGGKVGYISYTGDLMPGSGDIGSALQYGAVFEISTMPIVDFEFHASYARKEFDYTYDAMGISVTAPFLFQEVSVLALLTKNIFGIPGSPFNLYGGGGVGYHVMNTEVAKDLMSGSVNLNQATEPIELYKRAGRLSWNGAAGIRLKAPVLPLAVYGEGRYGRINIGDGINTVEMELGALLSF